MIRLHLGKKAPKGFRELPGSIHLGQGIWILKIERIEKPSQDKEKVENEK